LPTRISKILIVDDTPHNIDVLSATLADLDCELMVATSGARALELALRGQPDLLLLDVMMPGMDGFEVCRRLKADPATAGIPIIALTAHAMAEDREKALGAGCNEFETKPVDLASLLAKMETLLGQPPA